MNDNSIFHDKDGNPYKLDLEGKRIPLLQIKPENKTSGFTTYDESQGHCGLCGSLTCSGNCFK